MRSTSRIANWIVLTLVVSNLADAADTQNTTTSPNQPPVTKSISASTAKMAPPWWSIENWPSLGALGIDSWTDVFNRGRWSGSIETSIDQQQQKTHAPNSAEQKSKTRLTTGSITLRNEGFSLIDPRLVSGNIGLRLSTQLNQQTVGNKASSEQGELTDYNIDTVLLAEKAYPISLFANRSQSLFTLPSGGTTEGTSKNRGISLQLHENNFLRDMEILPWFSANLRALEEKYQNVTHVDGQSFRRDDERTTLTLDTHIGFETADLDFRIEHNDFINHTYVPGSYASDTAHLGYSLDFGSNLNRRWDSHLYYSSRQGSTSMRNISIDESLSVEHYTNLSSAYYYQVEQQSSPFGSVTTQSAGMKVQHFLYSNLASNLGFSGKHQDLPDGYSDTKTAQISFGYNHSLPWKGQFYASLGGSTQIDNIQAKSGLRGVFDAPYLVPMIGATPGFILSDLFIVPETLEVMVIKDGLRVPAMVNLDYLVVTEGDRTRIFPQPGGPAVIQPGDVLLINYYFRFDPSIKYRSNSHSTNFGLGWEWIGFSVSHEENSQKPISGGETYFLTSSTRDSVRLNLQGSMANIRASGDANFTSYRETNLSYDESRFSQYFGYVPTDVLMLSLNANEYRIEYHLPERQSRGFSVNLASNWLLGGGWFGTASLSRRKMQDSAVPTEVYTESIFRLQRRWTKLDLAMSFNLNERERRGVQSLNAGFHVSAIRRF